MTSTQKKTHATKKAPPQPVQSYQGRPIATIRDAISGDPGFNGTDGQQAVIRLEDGEEMTVLRSDLHD